MPMRLFSSSLFSCPLSYQFLFAKTLMKISTIDYHIGNLMSDYPALGVSLGNLETQLFRQKFVNTKISNPVYVMGLARSGTTILLDLLNQTGAFSSWQYRDHPFVMAPMLWHTATKWMVSKATKVERAHKDRIMVTPDSPEAFEELIWRAFSQPSITVRIQL